MNRTVGLSQKAVFAFLSPLIAAAVGSASTWALGGFGAFDTTSIVIAATGLGASGLALLGAYVGKPGNVVQTDPTPPANPVVVHANVTMDGKQIAEAVTRAAAKRSTTMPTAAADPVEAPAPFDPDGNDAVSTDITDWPLEAFVADPKDRKGADDVPVTA